MTNDIETLSMLCRSAFAAVPLKTELITGSGSNRRYFRLFLPDGSTVIGVIGENLAENEAFIYLDSHFAEKRLNVPRLLSVSSDRMAYLQEDLGDISLYSLLPADDNYDSSTLALLDATMQALADMQYRGAEGLDFSHCFPVEAFDRQSVMWDLNYYKYCYLKLVGFDFSEPRLESDFEKLVAMLLDGSQEVATFMYRDFQSRNVMVRDGAPWFIDFQGGRRGPAEYDVASFLWQARAHYPDWLRQRLIDKYISHASKYVAIDPDSFRRKLQIFVAFRMIQVLGAYGFRGLHERKKVFLDSIPAALRSLSEALQGLDLPEITRVTDELMTDYVGNGSVAVSQAISAEAPLTVTVMCFSYKKGLPTDESGNGGGFYFDCRGMHNPGRYDEYKQLTGKDKPVIDFLESRGEIQKFLASCYDMVDPSVETYIRRGFTNLMVCFGCTGGQHRSVYCAEHFADHLRNKYPGVNVKLSHREQDK